MTQSRVVGHAKYETDFGSRRTEPVTILVPMCLSVDILRGASTSSRKESERARWMRGGKICAGWGNSVHPKGACSRTRLVFRPFRAAGEVPWVCKVFVRSGSSA